MTYISAELRRFVTLRAGNCCEYCRFNQRDDDFTFHIDHIIAEKHGGLTTAENLCLCCFVCNIHKGSDIASIDPETKQVKTLFHPRQHVWDQHFQISGGMIKPLTTEARVTAFLLRFNLPQRIAEREILIKLGSYPCVTNTSVVNPEQPDG